MPARKRKSKDFLWNTLRFVIWFSCNQLCDFVIEKWSGKRNGKLLATDRDLDSSNWNMATKTSLQKGIIRCKVI